LGKWLSRDPLAEAAGLNLYAYVANNPINAIDPQGQQYTWVGPVNGALNAGATYYNYQSSQSIIAGWNATIGRDNNNPDVALGLANAWSDSEAAWTQGGPAVVNAATGLASLTGGPTATAFPGGEAHNPFASPEGNAEAVGAAADIAGSYDPSATSGFFSGLSNSFWNWWRKIHPTITYEWECTDNTGIYFRVSPNSPGPAWHSIKKYVNGV
jgi:hypothetical protein